MPTIEEIKNLLKQVKDKTISKVPKKAESFRPSPLPPMSPFEAIDWQNPNKESKVVTKKTRDLSEEIIREIYKAGF